MAELNIGDQSSMSAPTSLVPFKSTSQHITGLLLIMPTNSPNLEKNAALALPDHGTAHTERSEDDEIQLSASREIAQSECKLHNIMGAGIDQSREDKPVINGQLGASISLRNAQEEHKCTPLKKLKWEGRSYSPQEGEDEEGGESACVTPTAREQRIPQEILICPPPPCKKRHCKRKRRDAMAPSSSSSSSSSSPLQYPHLLAAKQAHAAALHPVVSPPDLHTFPECIRALFFPN